MNHKIYHIVISVLLALGILAAAHYLPLGRQEQPIIKIGVAPEIVTLNPGDTLRQTWRAKSHGYSDIVLFSSLPKITNQEVSVRVLKESGEELSKSPLIIPNAIYTPDNMLHLTVPLPWFATYPNEHLVAEIKLVSGDPLTIRASTGEDDIYKVGTLTVNNKIVQRDIALSLQQPTAISFGEQMGVLAGVAVLLAGLAISLIKKPSYQWVAVGILLVFITPMALGGFWFSNSNLGIADWDYYFSLHENYRQIILHYHSFPFWNPYTCGGTAGLGDPEFPGFTVTFLLELIFGIPVGLRLAIFTSIATGAVGMLCLGKRLRFSVFAALIAALGFAFGSRILLEIVEGHVNIFSSMWLPWFFWAWLAAYNQKKSLLNRWTLLSAIFLSLTFYAGGIYLLMYTALACIALPFFVSRPRRAILVTTIAGIWALGFIALKLLPVLAWLKQFPSQRWASSAYTITDTTNILQGRYLHGSYVIFHQGTGWQEYGAYIGLFIIGLALIGLSRFYKNRLVQALGICTIIVILVSSTGPLLKPYFMHMSFFPRSTVSRFIVYGIINISLLAAIGADTLRKKLPRITLLLPILAGIIAIDLMSLTYQLSEQSFVLPHVVPAIQSAPSPIAMTLNRYDLNGTGTRTTRTYDAVLSGWGTFAYCSVLGPVPRVHTIVDQDHGDYITANQTSASFVLKSWSPNKVVVSVTNKETTRITLNTNYVKGWYANNKPADNDNDRVAITIPPSTNTVITFQYKAPGFILGLIITIVTSLATIVWFWKKTLL